jgi:hypothetical protein
MNPVPSWIWDHPVTGKMRNSKNNSTMKKRMKIYIHGGMLPDLGMLWCYNDKSTRALLHSGVRTFLCRRIIVIIMDVPFFELSLRNHGEIFFVTTRGPGIGHADAVHRRQACFASWPDFSIFLARGRHQKDEERPFYVQLSPLLMIYLVQRDAALGRDSGMKIGNAFPCTTVSASRNLCCHWSCGSA